MKEVCKMKKYIVRWVVEGFVVKEEFNNYDDAEKYYDDTLDKMSEHLLEIDLYEWQVK